MKPANVTSPSEQVAPLPAAVAEIGKIHFEGNIIPHSWYQRITLESGKPDLPAIILLAEIIYWYRPYQTLDKRGKPLLRKHFDGDMFQCTAAYFVSKFGLTKDQTRKALKRLEDAGYIRREYRDIVQQGILRNCIMFVEPMPLAILAITHPAVATEATSTQAVPPSPVGDTLSPVGDTLSPVGDTLSPVGDIFICIETTTEISTETTTTTTPYPSSNEVTATTESVCRGGRGDGDQKPEDSDSGQELAALETTEEKPVSREEVETTATTDESGDIAEDQKTVASEVAIEAQRAELAFPLKLTESEYADIAAQVYPLPPEIAQQLLDVIEAKRRSGQIKTNPAAMLRGILRKRQVDPASFDPSIGFAIADARRRQLEEVARAQAEAEQRERAREASRITPESRESAHRSLAAMKALLRGHA